MAKSFERQVNAADGQNEDQGQQQEASGNANGNQSADQGDSVRRTVAVTASPSQIPSEEMVEEAAEGHHLYLSFVRNEMIQRGMEMQLSCLDERVDLPNPERILDWTRAGQELRNLADAFSRSKERQTVKERAQSVSLETLDFDNFFMLLQELFQGGSITRERILVLFFFCADVALEALRRGFHQMFHQLVTWSLRYITTFVANFVHSMGGWGVVLRQSLDIAVQVTACCAFVAIFAACVVFMRTRN